MRSGIPGVKGWKRQPRSTKQTGASHPVGVSSRRKRAVNEKANTVETVEVVKKARKMVVSLDETTEELAAAVVQPRQQP